MNELIEMASSVGLSVVCVCYLIYFQHTTMTKMLETLGGIDKRLALIESVVNKYENKATD